MKKCEICLKLKIKTPERRQRPVKFSVFFLKAAYFLTDSIVFLVHKQNVTTQQRSSFYIFDRVVNGRLHTLIFL